MQEVETELIPMANRLKKAELTKPHLLVLCFDSLMHRR